MRYFLEIAYDGTNYHGWQRQTNAISVQEVLEKALTTILQETIGVTGCGRTDTGVHAQQFFLHFDTERILKDDFAFRLNALLPDDVVAYHHFQTKDDAHTRFDATSRQYQYYIQQKNDPFQRNYRCNIKHPLSVDAMNKAAGYLLGQHDFTSFAKLHADTKTNLCEVTYAQWEEKEGYLVFTISANRFLRNMVRAVVGTLLEVGENKRQAEWLQELMALKDRSKAGKSVPAKGLFLSKVTYPYMNG